MSRGSAIGVVVCWRRQAGVLLGWSRVHVAAVAADRTLCGAPVPWGQLGPGGSLRCETCFRLAGERGLVDMAGIPIR